MINPNQQFADESHSEQLGAHQGEQHTEQQQGAAANVLAHHQFVKTQPGQNAQTQGQHDQGNATKGMNGPV